jgi:two-component system, NarL family, sensor histidine kinase UhpB
MKMNDSSGQPDLKGVTCDVTEHERMEEALRESEQRYRKLTEHTTDIIYILDKEIKLLYANQRAAALIGFSQAEMAGKRQEDLFPPEVARQHVEWIRQALETGEEAEYDELFRFGPQEVWMNVRLIPLLDEQGKVDSVMGVCRDITDRKQTELELTKSRAILQATIECLPFDFFALGSDGRYILQNATCKSHLGDYIGKTPEEICPNEEDLAIWLANNRRAFSGEKVVGDVCFSYQGGKRFFHNVIAPIHSGETTYGILGVNIDITERKQAEEVLLKAHEELEQRVKERTAELIKTNEELAVFRKFADTSGQGFGMGDPDGQIVYVNPTLSRLFGEDKPEDVVGKYFQAYYTDELNEKIENQVLPTLQREGHWEGEMPLRSRRGKQIAALYHFVDLKDDQGKTFRRAAVVTDITERKRAEETIRKSEERFRGYFEQGLMGMAVSRADKRWVEINDRLCEILGYSREELLQKKFTDFICPDDLEASDKFYRRLMAGEIDHGTVERRYIGKDGKLVYLVVFAKCFRSPDGKVDHVLALIDDVTQHKKAQQALHKEHRTLKHLLQSSDHERQLIAYEIHDGLAQQLAGAIMQLQTYKHLKETKPQEAEKAYEAGMTMLQQGHFEARRLINGVRPPVLDELGVVEAIAHLVHEESRRKMPKIKFLSRVDFDRLAPILENAIYRIIQEGLANACKHSKSEKVLVSLAQQKEFVRIEIQDHGVGFAPENVNENCFGLEGMRERARLLGGKSSVRSALGKGTHIIVELPLVERE